MHLAIIDPPGSRLGVAEVRACLDVAEARGYIEGVDEGMRDTLDRVVATLHQLSRR